MRNAEDDVENQVEEEGHELEDGGHELEDKGHVSEEQVEEVLNYLLAPKYNLSSWFSK